MRVWPPPAPQRWGEVAVKRDPAWRAVYRALGAVPGGEDHRRVARRLGLELGLAREYLRQDWSMVGTVRGMARFMTSRIAPAGG